MSRTCSIRQASLHRCNDFLPRTHSVHLHIRAPRCQELLIDVVAVTPHSARVLAVVVAALVIDLAEQALHPSTLHSQTQVCKSACAVPAGRAQAPPFVIMVPCSCKDIYAPACPKHGGREHTAKCAICKH